jgi:ethanolamine ammonia-lyase small subunit
MPFIDRKMAAQIREDLKKNFDEERPITGRDLIKELVPDIRKAMRNRYTLDAIAETISKRTDMSPSTIRGYLYGKDSVMKDPDVIARLEEAGLADEVTSRRRGTTTRLATGTATTPAKKKKKAS